MVSVLNCFTNPFWQFRCRHSHSCHFQHGVVMRNRLWRLLVALCFPAYKRQKAWLNCKSQKHVTKDRCRCIVLHAVELKAIILVIYQCISIYFSNVVKQQISAWSMCSERIWGSEWYSLLNRLWTEIWCIASQMYHTMILSCRSAHEGGVYFKTLKGI